MLHSIEEPTIGETGFEVRRTLFGGHGMLQNKVLMPKNDDVVIEKIGGKGKECWVNGQNYPNDALPNRPDPALERGEWRVEVSPKKAAKENYFLNVMQVAEGKCQELNQVKRIDGERTVGVQIADRVVNFSRNSLPLSGRFEMEFSGDKRYRIVMTDMKPGLWQVKYNGKVIIPAQEVRADDGVLSFEGAAGVYEFRR